MFEESIELFRRSTGYDANTNAVGLTRDSDDPFEATNYELRVMSKAGVSVYLSDLKFCGDPSSCTYL